MAGKKAGAAAKTGPDARMPDHIKKALDQSLTNDLSGVRVHSNAGNAGQGVGARAYAYGSDVMMAPGKYGPSEHYGKSLIGHEVAHVVQQAGGRVNPTGQM